WRTTTAATGSGPSRSSSRRRRGWSTIAGRLVAAGSTRRRSRRCATPCATTSTPRAPWRPWTPGPRARQTPRRTPQPPVPATSRPRSTRCSGSPSRADRPAAAPPQELLDLLRDRAPARLGQPGRVLRPLEPAHVLRHVLVGARQLVDPALPGLRVLDQLLQRDRGADEVLHLAHQPQHRLRRG